MDSILKSFTVKDTLCPEIWDGDESGYTLKPEIRKQLLEIANIFVEFIDIEGLDVDDITITGSLANYNWSKFSDIDLHILIDFTTVADNPDLVDNLLRAKKAIFNTKYEFTSKGHEIELYAQNVNEPHTSTGVYSILYNKWITEPSPVPELTIDTKLIKQKADNVIRIIKKLESSHDNPTILRHKIKLLKDKLGRYRQAGLNSGGEFSIENLVFKYLRRSEWLNKLSELEINALSDKLSVKEKYLDK